MLTNPWEPVAFALVRERADRKDVVVRGRESSAAVVPLLALSSACALLRPSFAGWAVVGSVVADLAAAAAAVAASDPVAVVADSVAAVAAVAGLAAAAVDPASDPVAVVADSAVAGLADPAVDSVAAVAGLVDLVVDSAAGLAADSVAALVALAVSVA